MSTQNRTLQALDFIIDDFGVQRIADHFRDVFKTHLRGSEGYDHDALADEYEIGTRIIDILKARKEETDKQKRIVIAKQRRKAYEEARIKQKEG